MREDRFYLSHIKNPAIEDFHTIHKIKDVLRKKAGDSINVFDGRGGEYQAVIKKFTPKKIEISTEKIIKKIPQPTVKITLGFSLLKSHKIDFIVQKGTELGIDEFIPFISKNTVVKEAGKSKLQRWMKISIEAAAQSKRVFLPAIKDVVSLQYLLEKSALYDLVLAAQPGVEKSVADIFKNFTKKAEKVLLIIGPEGGFSGNEIEHMSTFSNIAMVRISNFTLRSETASLLFSGLVAYFLNKNES